MKSPQRHTCESWWKKSTQQQTWESHRLPAKHWPSRKLQWPKWKWCCSLKKTTQSFQWCAGGGGNWRSLVLCVGSPDNITMFEWGGEKKWHCLVLIKCVVFLSFRGCHDVTTKPMEKSRLKNSLARARSFPVSQVPFVGGSWGDHPGRGFAS